MNFNLKYQKYRIWSAAKYRIPVVFNCFVNQEYKILKNLWSAEKGVPKDQIDFIGLDFTDPSLDLEKIAQGFGATVSKIVDLKEVKSVLEKSLKHQGPTFIMIPC